MKKRRLGSSGLEIAPLVLGGNVFGWTIDEKASHEILDAFVEAGFNCIDTADVYSYWAPGNQGGESETVIGSWLAKRGRRDEVIIATKVGMELAPDRKGLSRAYILRTVEESLRRLRTDYIDLYQSHFDDVATPVDETLEAYTTLVKQGKVRAIGASNYSAARLAESLECSQSKGYARYVSLQPEYNLYARHDFERELEPFCRTSGIAVIPYFGLARGFLTGKYRSEADLAKSARGEGVKPYLNERGFRILHALDEVAASKGSVPASVALAWLASRPTVTAPISSATSVEQLKALIEGLTLELAPADIARLDSASQP